MPRMKSVSKQLRKKSMKVKEFNIIGKALEKETKIRKNWTAPAIDGIQIFWCKRLKPARRALKRALEQAKHKNNLILVWQPSGRTIVQ